MAKLYYLGVDIGGTKCAVILGKKNNDSIDIIEKSFFQTAD